MKYSSWASPIVIVAKPNGSIRLCGDYKVSVNQHILYDDYSLPLIDDIITNVEGAKFFTKLDLKGAYNQMKLYESSQLFTTLNTPYGLYRYNTLPFGFPVLQLSFSKLWIVC